MYPEDRVLVGVINTKRDLLFAMNAHWYRIPQEALPMGVYIEYVAFFLSGSVFKGQSGTIAYYAPRTGVELAYRRDLVPNERDHPRADKIYYRVGLGALQEKHPPITNPSKRTITFIHTTWDRFHAGRRIADLYSQSDHFVSRVYRSTRYL